MLLSHRHIGCPGLDASLETQALVHSAYRVHLVTNRGVVCEDDLIRRAFARKGAVGRPVLTVVLEGRARLRVGDDRSHWLGPGDVAIFPSKESLSMRQEGDTFASIAVEWDPGTLASRAENSFGTVDERSRRRLAEVARGMITTDQEAIDIAAGCLAQMLDVLRAQGVPFGRADPGALIEAVTPRERALSGTLDRLLCRLYEQPMAIDLHTALGLSARQATRIVAAFNARYGFNAGGWRDAVNRRRVGVGAALMSSPRATTERVAARLGYSSPTAFCRAMASAGLPAPGAVAREVESLR